MFLVEKLLTPQPTPKLEDKTLSAVRNCLFNILAATLHIGGRSSIRNLRKSHAVATETHVSRKKATLIFITSFLMKDCQCRNSHSSIIWFKGQALWFITEFVAVDSRIARAVTASWWKLSLVKCNLLAVYKEWMQVVINTTILICGNKMPTRCNRVFLLQISLLAQHV